MCYSSGGKGILAARSQGKSKSYHTTTSHRHWKRYKKLATSALGRSEKVLRPLETEGFLRSNANIALLQEREMGIFNL